MSWLAGHGKLDAEVNDNLGVDWVLQYEFGDIGTARPSDLQVPSLTIDRPSTSYFGIPHPRRRLD